jgi:hypothetical protein
MIVLAVLVNAAAAQTTVVQWTGERVTVRAVNAPLKALLQDVASQTGIVLSGADRLAGRDTVDIRDAYLAEALSILLANVNFIVTRENGLLHLRVHSMKGNGPPPLAPISIPGLTDPVVTRKDSVVRPSGPADPDNDDEKTEELAALERVAESNDTDSLPQILDALYSDHSDVRIRALHLLAARSEEPDAIEEIASAFADHDMNVVSTASSLLASIPGRAALEAIESQLSVESGPALQLAALRSLALRGDVSSIDAVRHSAREGSIEVREFAEQLLKALEERARIAVNP